MARSLRCGGGGSRRSKTYWMCSCGGWNWDWRTTCLGCAYAAPPWVLDAAAVRARPQAGNDGWVGQPRGRRAQRQARGAAASAASAESQTSASGESGARGGRGAAATDRLQAAVGQLEALQAGPPDGVESCFTDVVASQLEAKRAELGEAQRAAAEQKEANAISKGERRLRAARQSLEQKQAARDLAEAQLQKAQQDLAQLDAEAEAQRRQRAAEWAGSSEVPGPLVQLDKLPEAWGSNNFEVAWAAIRAQVEAVRTLLAHAPAAPRRAPWAESCPMGEVSSEGGIHAGGTEPWQPQSAAERGQAERRGDARGEWPKVAQAFKRELVAEELQRRFEARAVVNLAAPECLSRGSVRAGAPIRPALEAGGPSTSGWPRAPRRQAKRQRQLWMSDAGSRCSGSTAMEVIEDFASRHGALPHLVVLQETRLAPHRLEEARSAARRLGYAAFLHAAAPTEKEGPLANSGGVAALSYLQAAESVWMAPCGLRHRMIGVTVAAASGLQFLACSLYLQDALGPKGINLDIFAAFGDMVLSDGMPWLAQGDFNVEPGTLRELGWPRVQRGTCLGPAECTCVAQGAEHVCDWFVGSFCLAHGVREATALDGFGLCPRKPVRLLLQDVRPDALVQVLVRPGRFPDVDAAACRPHEDAAVQVHRRVGRTRWQVEPCSWTWELGSRPSDACEAARQWIQVVESTLVGIHGIDDGDLPRYLGRSEGPKVVLKPLSAVVKREYRRRHSALPHAIRQALDVALQRLTADKTQRWQPVREPWYERQVERVLADVEAATVAACDEDEVEALEFDIGESGDLVSQAGLHGDPEAIAVLRRRLASFQRRDGCKSSASWRAWAKEAVQQGRRLAHRFAKAVPPPQVVDPDTGRPLAGMLAVGQLEANWQALWQQEGLQIGR
ncbi:unnamed protein product, partial [Prorocentrum cordatum]